MARPGDRLDARAELGALASGGIAVLLTCHNRRAETLRCLEALLAQDAGASLRVFLVDDGSTDGTGEAVRVSFPQVNVVQGDGSL